MILANANDLAMIINYNLNHSFIVLATVITIVNYDHKTFILQATEEKMTKKNLFDDLIKDFQF
jgi:hypothetical protein